MRDELKKTYIGGWLRVVLVWMLAVSAGSTWASATIADLGPEDYLYKGNAAYEQEDYRQAAEFYERALREGGPAFTLYYNLGNAYYHLQDVGRTVLNYERARLLEPRQEDLLFNRRHALTEAGAAEPEFGRWNYLLENFTLNEITLAGTGFLWLALGLGGFAVWRGVKVRRFPYVSLVGVVLFVGLGATLFIAVAHLAETRYSPEFAVVTAREEVEARSEPSLASVVVEKFNPGSQVFLLSTRGNWSYAKFQNGRHGWLPREAVTRVLPEE